MACQSYFCCFIFNWSRYLKFLGLGCLLKPVFWSESVQCRLCNASLAHKMSSWASQLNNNLTANGAAQWSCTNTITTVKGVQTIQKETFHNLTSSACHPAERKCLEAEARSADDVRFLGLYLPGAPGAGLVLWAKFKNSQYERILAGNNDLFTILNLIFTFKCKYATPLIFMKSCLSATIKKARTNKIKLINQ